MQRLGNQRTSAPNCAINLAPDEATPKTRAHLCCSFFRHSAYSHGYRPEVIQKTTNLLCQASIAFSRVRRQQRDAPPLSICIPYKERWLARRGARDDSSVAKIIG